MADEKIQKILARAGLGSRREAEKWIAEGRVKVNGKVATLGDRIDGTETVEFDGRAVKISAAKDQKCRVILYHKPEGEVSTRKDPENRPTVFAKLPPLKEQRWIAVGRLDINTTGLMLFTTDGELANALMHPSNEIDREYLCRVRSDRGSIDADIIQRMKEGVMLEDGIARFTDVKESMNEKDDSKSTNRWFYVVLMEGRNREVRRLWESQGVMVSRLKRVRFGSLFMPPHLRQGQCLELGQKEINDLCDSVDLTRRKVAAIKTEDKKKMERQRRKLWNKNKKNHRRRR